MPRYRVTVSFSGWHEVDVNAATEEEARDKVEEQLRNGELDPDETEFFTQTINGVDLIAEVTCQE